MQHNILSFVSIRQSYLNFMVVEHHVAWVLKDYTSQTLDLLSPDSYRE